MHRLALSCTQNDDVCVSADARLLLVWCYSSLDTWLCGHSALATAEQAQAWDSAVTAVWSTPLNSHSEASIHKAILQLHK